jgi:hypothetical protein
MPLDRGQRWRSSSDRSQSIVGDRIDRRAFALNLSAYRQAGKRQAYIRIGPAKVHWSTCQLCEHRFSTTYGLFVTLEG